jgi:hypothetical protein
VATITTEEYGGTFTTYNLFRDPLEQGPTSDTVYLYDDNNGRLRRRSVSGNFWSAGKVTDGVAATIVISQIPLAVSTTHTLSIQILSRWWNSVGTTSGVVVPLIYRPVSATSTTGQVTIIADLNAIDAFVRGAHTFTTTSTAPVAPALVIASPTTAWNGDELQFEGVSIFEGTWSIGAMTEWSGDSTDTLTTEYSWVGEKYNSASRRTVAGPGLITPLLVRNYGYNFQSRNIIHETLDTQTTYVTLRRPTARAGTLDLLMSSRIEAMRAEATLRSAYKFHFEAPETGEDYWFALSGGITVDWSEVQDYWIVTIDWREVSAPA